MRPAVPRPNRPTLALLGTAVLGAALLVARARDFLPFVSDDALISLRYAERLLSGKGLSWTDGERVEGYSNLLWTLLVAGGGLVSRAHLIEVAWGLGIGAMALACVAPLGATKASSWRALVAGASGCLLLASSSPLAVWAVGGLEQALLAALLAWASVLCLRLVDGAPASRSRLAGTSLLLGLMCVTRPDGALFALTLAAAVAVGAPRGPGTGPRWRPLTLLVVPAILVVGQLLFRVYYYGDWVPNTSYAKLSLTQHRLDTGLRYARAGWAALPLLPAGLSAAALLLFTRRRWRALTLLLPNATWCVYVVFIGGDIFPAHRHLVPCVVLSALSVVELLCWLAQRRRGLFSAGVGAAAVLLGLGCALERGDGEVTRARQERWEWDGRTLGNLLHTAFAGSAPLVASDPAGCVPFFSRLPALDLLGLNDRFLATHPPPDLGRGYLGHELGNGEYVLGRKPDILVFCGPRGAERACFRSGREMQGDPRFARDYALVRVADGPAAEFLALLWFRKEGRVGLRLSEDGATIPGFLFAGVGGTVAIPPISGVGLAVHVGDRDPGRWSDFSIPTGAWRFTAEAQTQPPPRVRVRLSGTASVLGEGVGSASVLLAESSLVDVEVLAAPGHTSIVDRVRLTRDLGSGRGR